MNLWNDAFDDMNKIDLKFDQLTLEQQLKVVEIKALLAIGQELSLIQDQGINPDWSQRED
ncbi:hypothetical protein NY537_10460 [Curtobacterium flaccumfaciens pv. betae]|uniref:hypothetical protein n=1 Tax=Curtobacterium flaccumfaciens TaxID=2035 RepID=UPI00265AC949|nr:hypothetical protein [Curtobacterium flaccumfaciens]MCS5513163.1 hypothetical protein [Curtobacterium flaccumfaciens pv. betae]